jgi:hypothetical protein
MIHCSHDEIKQINNIEQGKNLIKPRGLWVAESDQWLEYYKNHLTEIKDCRYMYRLKFHYTDISDVSPPDPKKVLKIVNESSFDKFTLRYGIVSKNEYESDSFNILINWRKVAESYGGIQIPLIRSRLSTRDRDIVKKYNDRFKFTDNLGNQELSFWLEGFDIASGCVWNSLAIKKIKRIYKI